MCREQGQLLIFSSLDNFTLKLLQNFTEKVYAEQELPPRAIQRRQAVRLNSMTTSDKITIRAVIDAVSHGFNELRGFLGENHGYSSKPRNTQP